MGTGLASVFLLTTVFLSEVETISPGFAVPEASTTSLVVPADGGLNGAGPDDVPPARSQGFGGGLLAAINDNVFQFQTPKKKKKKVGGVECF